MRQFRNEMTTKPPPKTVKEVILSLIPPKGIKQGKNVEGSELFDGEEIEEEGEDEDEGRKESTPINFFKLPLETFQSNFETEKETQECNAVTGNSVSLVSIIESDHINKDAKFR